MSVNDIYVITFVGIAATLFIDLYAFLLAKVFNIPSLNFCLVGRWGLGLLDGKFMHQNIAASPVKHFECVFGWCVHYFIGVLFSFLFILLVGIAWLEQPTLIAACIFGLASVSMPFFVMQPALGMGIMATKTASPLKKCCNSPTFWCRNIFISSIHSIYLGVCNGRKALASTLGK